MTRRVRKQVKMMRTLNASDALSSIIQASIDQTVVGQVCPPPVPPAPELRTISIRDRGDSNDFVSNTEFHDNNVPPLGEDVIDVASVYSESEDELTDEEEVPGGTIFLSDEHISTVFEPTSSPTSSNTPPNNSSDTSTTGHATSPFRLEKDESIKLEDQDLAMIELIQLCQDAGTPLWFFDKLMSTLRKHGKKKGFNVKKAGKRHTFLEKLRKNISCPRPQVVTVESGSQRHQVPKFKLLEQIIDLLQSRIFDDLSNICANKARSQRFKRYQPDQSDTNVEVCATKWYKDTHDAFVKNLEEEFLLPLVFYVDETGTDAFQRYPLEPFMFTFGNIRREVREKASSWRHAGFIPKVGTQKDPTVGLQMYHDCLAEILSDLVELQANPPLVTVNLGGIKKQVRLVLQVAFVMGDQKSQDKLCGRKNTNTGGAGRVHRGCMCSFPHASDTTKECKPVTGDTVSLFKKLRDISFEDNEDSIQRANIRFRYPPDRKGRDTPEFKTAMQFIKRRSTIAKNILGRTFTLHPIRNAFESLSFGVNGAGIHTATLDDPLHFCNSGLFMYMGETGYLGMTTLERKLFEERVQAQIKGTRSSVRQGYPRGRYASGFTNMTLLTADKKVGMIFTLSLALHDDVLHKQTKGTLA